MCPDVKMKRASEKANGGGGGRKREVEDAEMGRRAGLHRDATPAFKTRRIQDEIWTLTAIYDTRNADMRTKSGRPSSLSRVSA